MVLRESCSFERAHLGSAFSMEQGRQGAGPRLLAPDLFRSRSVSYEESSQAQSEKLQNVAPPAPRSSPPAQDQAAAC